MPHLAVRAGHERDSSGAEGLLVERDRRGRAVDHQVRHNALQAVRNRLHAVMMNGLRRVMGACCRRPGQDSPRGGGTTHSHENRTQYRIGGRYSGSGSSTGQPGPRTPTASPSCCRTPGARPSRRCRGRGGRPGRRRAPAAGRGAAPRTILPPSRVRVTTTWPSTGMRFSSLIAGTNQAVSGSRGWTATAKPNADGWTSRDLAPRCGRRRSSGRCRCGAGPRGVRAGGGSCDHAVGVLDVRVVCCSGGMNSARMPFGLAAPRSRRRPRVTQTPPQETPTETCGGSRGSTQTEWMPGQVGAAAEPLLALRVVPERADERPGRAAVVERNRPPGMVPHQSTPGSRRGRRPPAPRRALHAQRDGTLPQPVTLLLALGLRREGRACRSPPTSRRRRASGAAWCRSGRGPGPRRGRRRGGRAGPSRRCRRGTPPGRSAHRPPAVARP